MSVRKDRGKMHGQNVLQPGSELTLSAQVHFNSHAACMPSICQVGHLHLMKPAPLQPVWSRRLLYLNTVPWVPSEVRLV